ncbi:MAG: phage baseplate assembly protein V [Flavobacteriales bacterium]|jgi:uncharacterized protein involved in type VI secretion and phage assembly|nr:phage baseplate assembly protein V [Flavobacteriales bacterium]
MKNQHTEISIEGIRLKTFNNLKLKQPIYDHHEFELSLDLDSIEKSGEYTIEKSRDWLGKTLVINFQKNEFVGIITKIRLDQNDGFNGMLVLQGYSKSIRMESGKHLQSWNEKSIKKIVEEIAKQNQVDISVNPRRSDLLPYLCQYRESYFEFLKRQAIDLREWFYNDGILLHFGYPKSRPEPIELEYNKEVLNLQIEMKVHPFAQELISFQKNKNEFYIEKSKNRPNGLSELGMHAFKTSKEIYSLSPKSYSDTRIRNKGEFDDALKNNQNAVIADYHVINGSTATRGLKPGAIIKLSAGKIENGEEKINQYGEFIIIEAVHEDDSLSNYSCHFKAIPSGVQTPPIPETERPMAQTQMATVFSNEDPYGKGRVQVKFPWQDPHSQTDWISVLTPDGGNSDLVKTNRGFVFIPEKGDQVMVGFRYNDPNRPFVMGSVFNGINATGGGETNALKSIKTRSGHTIEFNDSQKSESIIIKDKNNNSIFIDTANSSIRISAPEHISISSKNIDISAHENLTISAGENMGINSGDDLTIGAGKDSTISSGEDMNILAKNITEQASENFESLAMNLNEQAEKISKNAFKEDIELNSSGQVKNNSGDRVNLF